MERFVVKVGTSLVADDDGNVRRDRLEAIVGEIASLHAEGSLPVLVTSGAVAYGLFVGDVPRRPQEVDALQAASAIGQGRLYRIYSDLFDAKGISTAQVLLTFFDMSARNHYVNARRTLERLLKWRVVPIINENDTTATDEIGFGDNDFLAAQVAILLRARRLVMLTDAQGLYDRDPRKHGDARMIDEVRDPRELDALDIGAEPSPLGTGGMRSKVVAAEMATAAGVPAVVCSGEVDGALSAAASGEAVGTLFRPQPRNVSSFKLWLRYAKMTRGHVTVDGGAAGALREGGRSLLPVGVVAVSGDFTVGDAIDITDGDGRRVAKGISNYSSEELSAIKGMRSSDAKRLVPRASEEVVHRDYLVMLD